MIDVSLVGPNGGVQLPPTDILSRAIPYLISLVLIVAVVILVLWGRSTGWFSNPKASYSARRKREFGVTNLVLVFFL